MSRLSDGLDPWRETPPDWPDGVRALTIAKARRRTDTIVLNDADIDDAASAVNVSVAIEIKLARTYTNPEAVLELRIRDTLTTFVRVARRRSRHEHLRETGEDPGAPPESPESPPPPEVAECLVFVIDHLWRVHDTFAAAYEAARDLGRPSKKLETAKRRLNAVLTLLAEIYPELEPDLSGSTEQYREGVHYHANVILLSICKGSAACRIAGYCGRATTFGDKQDAKRRAQDARRREERER